MQDVSGCFCSDAVCMYIYIYIYCIYEELPDIWVQVRSRPTGADHGQTMREAQVLPPLTFLYRVGEFGAMSAAFVCCYWIL